MEAATNLKHQHYHLQLHWSITHK